MSRTGRLLGVGSRVVHHAPSARTSLDISGASGGKIISNEMAAMGSDLTSYGEDSNEAGGTIAQAICTGGTAAEVCQAKEAPG